jgi:hypothetical protein
MGQRADEPLSGLQFHSHGLAPVWVVERTRPGALQNQRRRFTEQVVGDAAHMAHRAADSDFPLVRRRGWTPVTRSGRGTASALSRPNAAPYSAPEKLN